MRDLVSNHVVIHALRAVDGISCPPPHGSRGSLDYVLLQHEGVTLAQAIARPLSGHRPHHARLKLRGGLDARRLPQEVIGSLQITDSGIVIVEESNIAEGVRLIQHLAQGEAAGERKAARSASAVPDVPAAPSGLSRAFGQEPPRGSAEGRVEAVSEGGHSRPCRELVKILAPALEPCRHFAGACAGIARWDPVHGHVPRGFTGGFGTLDQIELVLVVAEPGDPFTDERYDQKSSPVEQVEKIAEFSYQALTTRDQFNTNLRRILNDCWPGLSLHDQMRRTWKAESYLCSAPRESGSVPRPSWSVCGRDYLARQLDLLADRAIVACGGKARDRIRALGFTRFLAVPAIAPPEGNKPHARAEHRKIPAYVAQCNARRKRL